MELRKDYILERYSIVSEKRENRPNEFTKHTEITQSNPSNIITVQGVCIFCPSHETMTPEEIGHSGEPWRIRWFENKFPAEEPKGQFEIRTDNKYFTFSDAYGYHEIIVDTNDHQKQMHDLNEADLRDLFRVYKQRTLELSNLDHIKYVLAFKNYGKEAGTSIKHSHSQIVAFNHIPALISQEMDAIRKYENCPYCEILNIEKGSYRRCFENDNFIAFTPYQSRCNYEIWIFPKKHYSSITLLDDFEILELTRILKKIFSKIKALDCAYNLVVHNTPKQFMKEKTLHFHIEILPRINMFAGIELGSETYVNTLSPEAAARFYRGE